MNLKILIFDLPRVDLILKAWIKSDLGFNPSSRRRNALMVYTICKIYGSKKWRVSEMDSSE